MIHFESYYIFNVGNQKQFELHYLSPSRLSSAISYTCCRSQICFVHQGSVCVAECEMAGLCFEKGHSSGGLQEWGSIQMGCVHIEACLLGNPPAWSRFLIDEICSHILQLTPDDSSLTLTGWHWSCTTYFSPSPIFLSLSLPQELLCHLDFFYLLRKNNETLL